MHLILFLMEEAVRFNITLPWEWEWVAIVPHATNLPERPNAEYLCFGTLCSLDTAAGLPGLLHCGFLPGKALKDCVPDWTMST
jgi:hypothetical protein